MLHKKCELTYEEVRDRYEIFRARCLEGVPKIPKHGTIPKESGCDVPISGIKSKTVINIVPMDKKIEPFKIDPKCAPKRIALKKKSSKKY
jgi:hypothetical protein